MKSTVLERLESLLESRKLDRTLISRETPGIQASPTISTGIEPLDSRLGGGWRQGEVSEIVGSRSSSRTSLLVATLAAATSRGALVGLVDTFDRFDPLTSAQAGLDLDCLLWVRGPSLTLEGLRPHRSTGSRCSEARVSRPEAYPDRAVHQAIRALDLIVRAGGFAVAALDLADVPPVHLRGLPFTTWMRLAHANEGRETVCLLVGDADMGKSARGASVRLESVKRWTGRSGQSRRFGGFDIRARIVSARTIGTGQSTPYVLLSCP